MDGPHDTDPPSRPGLLAVPVIPAGKAEKTLSELFALFFDAWLAVEGAALACARAADATAKEGARP